MNAKQAKAIRKTLNIALAPFGLTHRVAQYHDQPVKSRKWWMQVKNVETGEITTHIALQRVLSPGCPRDMYKKVKRNVRQQRIAA